MSDTPRTDAVMHKAASERGWTGTYHVMTDHARTLERENAALLLVAQYYAQGGPFDGGSYARIKLAAIDGITCAEQDSEIAKQRADDVREFKREQMRGINAKD